MPHGEFVTDTAFGELRAALLEHGVLVLREQRMTPEQQVALGRRFGELEGQEFNARSPHPDVITLSNVAEDGKILQPDDRAMLSIGINERWHTDSSFREVPAAVSIFSAAVVPAEGGDTFYANMRAGWQALDPAERAALRGLRAVHDYDRAYTEAGGILPEGVELPPVSHPVVRAHPETGEPSLYVSAHAFGIEGMSELAGRALLGRLLDVCTRDENVYRHRWAVGDLLLWDNRCMLHRAQGFDGRNGRTMHHVRVSGNEAVIAYES